MVRNVQLGITAILLGAHHNVPGAIALRRPVSGNPFPFPFFGVTYFEYDVEPKWEPHESSGELAISELLEQAAVEEQERLERALARIDAQLDAREELFEESVAELEGKLEWYLDRLETLYQRNRGSVDERGRLKARIREFYAELRDTKRERWRDTQSLQESRRDLQHEIEELSGEDWLAEFLE